MFKRKEMKFVGLILTQNGIKNRPWEDNCHPQYASTTWQTKPSSIYRYDQISIIILPKFEYRHQTSNTTHQKRHDIQLVSTSKDVIFNWSAAQHTAFEKAKSLIASTAVLQYFDPRKQVVIQVDASENGRRGTLQQKMILVYSNQSLSHHVL